MEYTITVHDEDRIAIPSELRERLGVRSGDRVRVEVDNGVAVLHPTRSKDNPFAKYAGCLGGFETMEEIVAREREMRDPEKEYM